MAASGRAAAARSEPMLRHRRQWSAPLAPPPLISVLHGLDTKVTLAQVLDFVPSTET